jgi:Predicted oxidoreductases (related to aryl-alcohol dehydrogenases)
MVTRRNFITKAAVASAAVAAAPLASFGRVTGNRENGPLQVPSGSKEKLWNAARFPSKFGIGGVAIGNGFHVNTNEQITRTLEAAWDAGVRYYDTSPFYGFGLSERRMGHFLFEKKREDFLISTKIGRVFEPDTQYDEAKGGLWKGQLNFKYHFDYSAEGVRKSIEDSLQRLGLSYIDMVLVHDLSPDTADLGEKWLDHFEIARKGAFPELTRLREEGVIKSWGLGVNTPQPILKSLEVADPDIMLVAIQYTLFDHKNALNHVLPALQERNIKVIIGGPFNSGFAAGKDRWNYGNTIPGEMVEKREKINAVIRPYGVDLRTVALQFSALHPAVGSVIPGASLPEQAKANVESFAEKIPADLWRELKAEKLIEENAPVGD